MEIITARTLYLLLSDNFISKFLFVNGAILEIKEIGILKEILLKIITNTMLRKNQILRFSAKEKTKNRDSAQQGKWEICFLL